MKDAVAVVVIMSPRAGLSPYANLEWAFALACGVRVIPVLSKLLQAAFILDGMAQSLGQKFDGRAMTQLREAGEGGAPPVAVHSGGARRRLRESREARRAALWTVSSRARRPYRVLLR